MVHDLLLLRVDEYVTSKSHFVGTLNLLILFTSHALTF